MRFDIASVHLLFSTLHVDGKAMDKGKNSYQACKVDKWGMTCFLVYLCAVVCLCVCVFVCGSLLRDNLGYFSERSYNPGKQASYIGHTCHQSLSMCFLSFILQSMDK